MAEFYDHPITGKLHLRAAAGGGNSEFDGVATAADFRAHPEAHGNYLAHKQAAHDRARHAEEARLAALKAEDEAIQDQIAQLQIDAATDTQPSS